MTDDIDSMECRFDLYFLVELENGWSKNTGLIGTEILLKPWSIRQFEIRIVGCEFYIPCPILFHHTHTKWYLYNSFDILE